MPTAAPVAPVAAPYCSSHPPSYNLASRFDPSAQAEIVAESIKQVLSGTNPPATRSFTRFTRDQLCEEALLFWIEANDYALLFQPLDQMSRAQAIFDTYMGAKAKFKVSVSDVIISKIDECLGKKEVTNALFVTAQREVPTARASNPHLPCTPTLQAPS